MSTDTLLPEVTVAGRTLRPWSVGQIAKVGPHISTILGVAQRLGLDLTPMVRGGLKAVDQVALARVFLESGMAVLEILAISLKEPLEKIEEGDPGHTIPLLQAVFALNKEHLKNSLAPLLAGAGPSATKTTS